MGRNKKTTPPDVIDRRREIVGRLRARGKTIRAICEMMGAEVPGSPWYFLNPQTKKPWSRETVANDLDFLAAEWKKNAELSTAERMKKLLSEVHEVRNSAWNQGDLSHVMGSIKQEVSMFGMEAPQQLQLTGKDGGPVDFRDVSDDDLMKAIVAAAAVKEASKEEVKEAPVPDGSDRP